MDPKNWRPISLLCADYKILSNVLTNRLKTVIASVVSPVQSCGVPGRFSGENVRLLQDIINHANSANIGGALLSLDQEKPFDRVDWSFMHRVLQQMNFGPVFRSWLWLLHTAIYSCVLVNKPFRVTRSVRQGCPLPPLLYILVAELFPVPSRKLQTSTVLSSMMKRTDSALHVLFSHFTRYENASGVKLGVTKSHGLLFGSWNDRCNMPVPLDWSSEAVTVLG